jgi:hypothetical protein
VLVGNEFSKFAEHRYTAKNAPGGRIHEAENYTIWLKRWSDVFHEARSRYSFFQQRLEVEVSTDDGVAHLKEKYEAWLSGKGLTKKKERERGLT